MRAVDDETLETAARLAGRSRIEIAVGTAVATTRNRNTDEHKEEGPAHGAVL
jgi:hypothetical protein